MTALAATIPGAARTIEALPLHCPLCPAEYPPSPRAICEECLAPLAPTYPDRPLPGRDEIAARPTTLWRYQEWLPFTGEPVHAIDAGWTPLLDAPALARLLGVRACLLKVDAWSRPTLSFKDRVVATAMNAAHTFGLDAVGCASTGNLANALAAAAARAGLPAWIFVPEDLEPAKLAATAVYGARLVRVRGSYDDVNRLCAQLADRFNWGFVNVNLRAYYGEGSKTMAYEIAEQLGWRTPDAVVAPMAGGSLVTRLQRGFADFLDAGLVDGQAPRIFGTQADGCAPIVRLFERGESDDTIVPEVPRTVARSLAIGNPADGRSAVRALRASGGGAARVDDDELRSGMAILAESTGVFGETAAGVTVAGALRLASSGHFHPDDEVVLCITGNGLKTTDALREAVDRSPVVDAKVRAVAALVET